MKNISRLAGRSVFLVATIFIVAIVFSGVPFAHAADVSLSVQGTPTYDNEYRALSPSSISINEGDALTITSHDVGFYMCGDQTPYDCSQYLGMAYFWGQPLVLPALPAGTYYGHGAPGNGPGDPSFVLTVVGPLTPPATTPLISNLSQAHWNSSSGAVSLAEGGTSGDNVMMLSANVNSPSTRMVMLEVQVSTSTSFDNPLVKTSAYVPSGSTPSVSFKALGDGQYYWRARTVDERSNYSDWQQFGALGSLSFSVHVIVPNVFLNLNSSAPSGYWEFSPQIYSINDSDILQLSVSGGGTLSMFANCTPGNWNCTAYLGVVRAGQNLLLSQLSAGIYYGFRAGPGPSDPLAFTLTVTGSQSVLSSDSSLSSLVVNQGSLSPSFTTSTFSYADEVGNSVTSINVTPTANDSGASISVNGNSVVSGASLAAPLNVGSNTINVVVTAANSATSTYAIVVTRAGISNVMFLPGLMGSDLYTSVGGKCWITSVTFSDENYHCINMSNTLTSETPGVVTRNAVSEYPDSAVGSNVYKTMLANLAVWQTKYDIIATSTPYDWRYDINHIVDSGYDTGNGIAYDTANGTPYLIQKFSELAASSPTGKVTIIAHSMGGLVTKALINRLEARGLSNKVDQIIFIDVPQLGTPKAVATLLHGTESEIPKSILFGGLVLSAEKARSLAQNMQSTAELLPSSTYFSIVDNPVIQISSSTLSSFYSSLYAKYGDKIRDVINMDNFMSDTKWGQPTENDLNHPAVINPAMLSTAKAFHDSYDNWTPPIGAKLVTISGSGLDTLVGIDYIFTKTGNTCAEYVGSSCARFAEVPSISPRHVLNGDGTVVTQSAQYQNGVVGDRYYVDLPTYNNNWHIDRDHSDITEIPQLQMLLERIAIKSNNSSHLDYISATEPVITDANKRIHLVLQSPLTLGFQDNNGNFAGMTATGTIALNIPGARYERYGEIQWLSLPKDIIGTIQLSGTGNGTFNLEVREELNGTILNQTTFVDVPTATTTKVTMAINTSDITQAGSLQVDTNGTGAVDFSLAPQIGADVTIPRTNLIVTPNDALITFGGAIPTFTYAITGYTTSTNGDSINDVTGVPECTTTANILSSLGTYPITCAQGTLNSKRYNFVFVPGTLKITSSLTVTADNKVMTYGNVMPDLTTTISGFVGGDDATSSLMGAPVCSTTATPTSGLGTYPIICAVGTLTSQNYDFVFVAGTLQITSSLVVTADNKAITFGGSMPELTATISGFVNGDTAASSTTGAPICTTTATPSSSVGTYPITCTQGTLASPNYNFLFVPGSLSITYNFGGFQQPIKPDGTGRYEFGRTLPIKFSLSDANGNDVSTANARLTVTNVKTGVIGINDVSIATSTMDNDDNEENHAEHDAINHLYVYNLRTKRLSVGPWRISVSLDDGKTYSALITLKRDD